jgi:hypothetical protein
MTEPGAGDMLGEVIGKIPYRMALAGGWIDQPFMSRLNPSPPGSMVVVGLEPNAFYMERCGMATGTRNVALKLWGNQLPSGDPAHLARELYEAENREKPDPSGSQDMVGLIYPGISRLDYDYKNEGGYFPAHIETCCDPGVASWLEQVIHLMPVMQRPAGYNPLGIKHLDPEWICRLGQTGKDCFAAILAKDLTGLAKSFNRCMKCWEAVLPQTVRHPAIAVDLDALLKAYQARYPGAMFSGCGGGYMYVVSDKPVPGTFQVKIRLGQEAG